jgi:hypothetical protein
MPAAARDDRPWPHFRNVDFRRIRFPKIRIHARLQIMVKQTAGELLQGEDLESCAIPEPLNKFLNRGVSVARIAAREGLTATTESAAKWRRNVLKRLNPGWEMVGPRKPRTHDIWYTGARPTVRSD